MRIFYINVSTIKTYRQTVIYRELSQHVLLKEKKKKAFKYKLLQGILCFISLPFRRLLLFLERSIGISVFITLYITELYIPDTLILAAVIFVICLHISTKQSFGNNMKVSLLSDG